MAQGLALVEGLGAGGGAVVVVVGMVGKPGVGGTKRNSSVWCHPTHGCAAQWHNTELHTRGQPTTRTLHTAATLPALSHTTSTGLEPSVPSVPAGQLKNRKRRAEETNGRFGSLL